MYVEELIGPQTVNTMPKETIVAFQDHGSRRGHAPSATSTPPEAARTSSQRSESTTTTSSTRWRREGVQKFADSFGELLDGIRAKRAQLVAA